MSDPAPALVTNREQLAAAHGPGIDVHDSKEFSFIEKGQTFTKYHHHESLLSKTGKRQIFYQNNHLFWVKSGASRPSPGDESSVDSRYHSSLTDIQSITAGKGAAGSFQTKAGHEVSDDRAFSIVLQRGQGKQETVDFEAASVEERDHWVSTLNALVKTAKQTASDKEVAIKVINVTIQPTASGEVEVVITPIGETQHTEQAAAVVSSAEVKETGQSTAAATTTTAPIPSEGSALATTTTVNLDRPAQTETTSTSVAQLDTAATAPPTAVATTTTAVVTDPSADSGTADSTAEPTAESTTAASSEPTVVV